ncbi:MAG: hypothetical protein NT023_02245 [Armatimonadetes bacterium]|nr:hypothetical protein [Armatimonadota bacterium]
MSSPIADMQKIVVTLSEANLTVDPGEFTQMRVTVTNRQETADRLLLEVEGIDVEWYGIPVPAVNLDPNGQAEEAINFRIQRTSENHAGAYPFLVRVRAMETGAIGVAQATLTVKSFSSLQLELNPKRGIATFFQPLNEFEVSLSNQGNQEEALSLYASDADDECAYEFEQEHISIKPGQTLQSPLLIRPKSIPVWGSGKLYGFTISARAASSSYATGNTHGQLERRSLISPLLGIFLALVAIGGSLTWYLWPRPLPALKIHSFTALNTQVPQGGSVTISWDVQPNFESLLIKRRQGDGPEITENIPSSPPPSAGSISVTPQGPQTTYTLEVRRKDGVTTKQIITIDVTIPPPSPKPSIAFFRAEPDKVHEGDTILLSWQSKGAVKLLLDPGNMSLPLYEQTRPLIADKDTIYTLRAIGSDEKVFVEKTVKVTVAPKDTCIAEISAFGTDKKKIYVGDKIKLLWQTRYAKSIRIDSDKGTVGESSRLSGNMEVPIPINEPITFTITVGDTSGKFVTHQLVVTPEQRPVPPPETQPNTEAGTNPSPTPTTDGKN